MTYELIKQTKFLNFTELPATGKTRIIGVGNNSGEKLASIMKKMMGILFIHQMNGSNNVNFVFSIDNL